MAGCGHAWNQPHPGRGRRPRLAPRRHVLRHRSGPDDERHHVRVDHDDPLHLPRAGRRHVRRPRRRDRSTRSRSTASRSTRPTAYADSRITLTGLAADNELVVRADCTYSRTGEGLHRFVDPADDRVYLYSQFEVPDARRVFTTFEQPDLKAPFTFTVTAPSHWKVVSNAPTPTPEDLADGKARVAVPARPSRCRRTSPRWSPASTTRSSTPTRASTATSRSATTAASRSSSTSTSRSWCSVTRQGFEFFEDAFDYPYPFGKYDQLYVPEYNMGAMENAGCVTLRDEYLPRSRQDGAFYEFRASVILHEMAHMWFGDLVTMKWWDDLWLNESFAEWACYHAAVEATEFTESWTGFTNARKNWAYRQDQLPSTHPIAADNVDLRAVEVNFDGITYAKGASVLKQLVAWVGLENFLTGLQGLLQGLRVRELRVHRPARRAREGLRARARHLGPGVAADLRREHPGAGVRAGRRRQLRVVRRTPDGGRRLPDAAPAPARDRPLRRARRPPRAADRLRDRRRGRPHRGPRPGRREAARPAAAQRRRPRLRQDPARRAVAGDGGQRPRHPRRLAGPGAVLGRGVGHDPRRRDECHRLRRRWSCSAVGSETDAFGVSRIPGYGAQAVNTYSAPGQPRRRSGPRWEQRPARRCWTRPSRAATTSCRSCAPTPPRRTATRRWRRSRACSTARCPSTGSPSTPTCAGTC